MASTDVEAMTSGWDTPGLFGVSAFGRIDHHRSLLDGTTTRMPAPTAP